MEYMPVVLSDRATCVSRFRPEVPGAALPMV